MKILTGFNSNTAQKLLLDAGVFFKNFTVGTDTYESAKAGGKLIGATSGGGSFDAIPTVRQIQVDGVKGKVKGLEVLDEWAVNLKANVIETTEDVIKMALMSVETDTSVSNYTGITVKNNIDLDDYIENITWIGTLSGSDEPVIIQVYNALDMAGLSLTMADKANGTVALDFSGHYDYDGETDDPAAPFKIFYPSR